MRINRRWIEGVIIVGLLFYAIGVWIYRDKAKHEVLHNYAITKGHIVDYYMVSIHDSRYLTYEYEVDNIKYKRKTNPSIYFDQCEKNIGLCEEKQFWVIYSPKSPQKSLINLSFEIQNLENPQFPRAIKDFE